MPPAGAAAAAQIAIAHNARLDATLILYLPGGQFATLTQAHPANGQGFLIENCLREVALDEFLDRFRRRLPIDPAPQNNAVGCYRQTLKEYFRATAIIEPQ